MEIKNLTFRKANTSDINFIHEILYKSFKPYQKFYTDQAFAATVISHEEIKNRILKNDYDVFVSLITNQIVGTVSLLLKNKKFLYIRSMAVHPDFQRIGIGVFMLDKIFYIAEKKKIKKLVLESSEPLFNALNFYEKNGFKKTGSSRDFYGVEIFEMIKNIIVL